MKNLKSQLNKKESPSTTNKRKQIILKIILAVQKEKFVYVYTEIYKSVVLFPKGSIQKAIIKK